MEWIKIVTERLFGFLTALIPGSAAMYLLSLHYPQAIKQLWSIEYLGYQAKITILLSSIFLVGFTISAALGSIIGFTQSLIGTTRRIKEPEFKPWHNPNWRALLTKYLSEAAPVDIEPLSDAILQDELKAILQSTEDEDERQQRILDAVQRKNRADLNDYSWSGWWNQLHGMLAFDHDPITAMKMNVIHNLQAASLVLLCGIPFNPSLRHWWLIAICVYWIVVMVAEGINVVILLQDPWKTFHKQMAYLEKKLVKERSTTNDAN
jgi:hypothetical protein